MKLLGKENFEEKNRNRFSEAKSILSNGGMMTLVEESRRIIGRKSKVMQGC